MEWYEQQRAREARVKNLRLGDRVYVDAQYHPYWRVGVVKKITPTGFVDVAFKVGDTERVTRFNAQGKRYGAHSRYDRENIDWLSFDERTTLIARDERARRANRMVQEIVGRDKCGDRCYDASDLNGILQLLEARIAEARKFVEAIDGEKLKTYETNGPNGPVRVTIPQD